MDKDNQLLEKQGYQILKTIGKGSFGQVFLVYNEQYGAIAAKVMKEEDFNLGEWQTRGKQNLFVLEYHSANLYGENAIILMQYANLGSLENNIEQQKDIPIPIIRVIMKQLFEGLCMMHEKGLIHRDIKGQNILLHSPTGSGRVIIKIADFGLVKSQKEPQKSTVMSVAGTFPYMASELILGSGEQDGQVKADEKIDVWASGIVLHQLALHSFPFKSLELPAIIMFMINKKLVRPQSFIDDALWDLITKLLAFDRKQRISAKDALMHPFFTSQQARNEISPKAVQLAQSAQINYQNGDRSITRFDTEPSLQLPYTDIQQFLNNINTEEQFESFRNQLPTKFASNIIPDPTIHASMLGNEQQISSPQSQSSTHIQITPPPNLLILPQSATVKQMIPPPLQNKKDQIGQNINIFQQQDAPQPPYLQQKISPQVPQQTTPPIIPKLSTPSVAPQQQTPQPPIKQQSPSTISSQELED
ncbi:MAG: putative CAMK/CAMKL/AMPK protein kinase, partial [Streblomastix strix]